MKEPNNYTTKFSQSYRSIGPYLGLGTQLAASIIVMFFLGRWLDSELDTYPIMIIVFSFLGVFAGMYNFIKTVTKLNSKKKSESKN
jgi:F0F1-type ATP synthase assembly protein I